MAILYEATEGCGRLNSRSDNVRNIPVPYYDMLYYVRLWYSMLYCIML